MFGSAVRTELKIRETERFTGDSERRDGASRHAVSLIARHPFVFKKNAVCVERF